MTLNSSSNFLCSIESFITLDALFCTFSDLCSGFNRFSYSHAFKTENGSAHCSGFGLDGAMI